MPEDKRLYMTFPIDMHRHPKVSRLPVSVRWTFFEMNGEARIADNDGVFSEAEAEYLWPRKHLEALASSHPERPLVVHENGSYVIRDYAEHQETRAAREARAERNRANGSRGGRPKNPVGSESVAGRKRNEPKITQSQSQSQSKDLTDTTYLPQVSPEIHARANGPTSEERTLATRAGIKNLEKVHAELQAAVGEPLSFRAVPELVEAICKRSKAPVRNVDGYVFTACKDPVDVRWDYERLDLGAVK